MTNKMILLYVLLSVLCFSQFSLGGGADEAEIAKFLFRSGDYSKIGGIILASKEGDHEAQYLLGEAFFWGKGIGKDYIQSKRWYLKSADGGFSEAQYLVASFMLEGSFRYVRSPSLSIQYLEGAASNNYMDAICALVDLQKGEYSNYMTANWIDMAESQGLCGVNGVRLD
ncbi:MAG: SEL1-like repeat protein [Pseudomonadales bacterium]|nr:SEL1-like repeat protein [Pseudomonadales bacterium]